MVGRDMLCRLVSGQFVVVLISRVGLVPDLDSFSGDADGALGVRAGLEG